ncbi:MAG: hypothetical protein WD766_14645 [Gemmatimonadota bacterium]
MAVLSLLLAVLAGPSLVGAQGVPPDAEWLTFETEHFIISYTEGLLPLARRAADRAERAYTVLSERFVTPPEGRVHVLIADNVDYSNGSATPFPRNRIIAYAQPPASEGALAYHDDWLELLLLHELVHIFHFDYAETIWQPLRRVFGRDPFLFPQIYSPGWVVEGLGTYFESEYTAGGRVRGSTYDMILRTAILEDAFFRIDQVTIDPVSWPGGTTRYVYGSLFIDHLARRYGAERVPEFVQALGRQLVPYRVEAAARSAFGTTLSREWTVWEDSLTTEYRALADSLTVLGVTEPEILTRGGRLAHHPRYSPDGSRIAYAASTGRDEAAILILEGDGSVSTAVERSSIGPAAWLSADELLHAQLDFDGPYRILSDLHAVELSRGGRRMTRHARVWEPDAHPDGDRAVVVASAEGTNVLARVDLSSGVLTRLTEPSLETYWSAPRWSPSGDRIAVNRWRAGGLYDVVVLDESGAVLREVTRDRAIDSGPAWSSDGRYLLFSSDRTGISNLFAYDFETGALWQVTNVLSGAFEPEISPDGRWIAFSYYRSDGYYIARIPFDPESWREGVAPLPAKADGAASERLAAEAGGRIREYSAWPTLLPTHWAVSLAGDTDLGFGLGVGVGGEDVIQRHVWEVQLLGYPEGTRLDAGAAYRYRGLGNPVLDLRIDQQWQVQQAASTGGGDTDSRADLMRREREAAAGLSWVLPSWRSRTSVHAGLDVRDVDFLRRDRSYVSDTPVRRYPLDLGARIGVGYSSVRGYGLSLGAQEGFSASAQLQGRRFMEPLAWDPEARDYWRATSRGRFYSALDWFGFAPPVFAVRVDAGVESEAASPGFSLGGTGGVLDLSSSLGLLGRGLAYPLRGFAPGQQRGNRVLSASTEYRFPLVLVESGFRLIPLALDRIWGDLFLDVGTAWCADPCADGIGTAPTSPDPLISFGFESILELKVGYFADLPLRTGIAIPLVGDTGPAPQLYLRIGSSF